LTVGGGKFGTKKADALVWKSAPAIGCHVKRYLVHSHTHVATPISRLSVPEFNFLGCHWSTPSSEVDILQPNVAVSFIIYLYLLE
jgi:hypothetical protein